MSNINKADVEQVAKLARLELTIEEKNKYTEELGEILNYVEELNEVDTTDLSLENQNLFLTNIARRDEISNQNDRENLFSNAPAQEKGFIKVKKVFE